MNTRRFFPVYYLMILLIVPSFLFIACLSKSPATEAVVEISNFTELTFKDVVLQLDDPDFLKKISTYKSENIIVSANKKVIPSQLIDLNKDGMAECLLVLCDIGENSKYNILIHENSTHDLVFKKRTQAELSIKEGGRWEMVTKENGTQKYEYIGGSFKNVHKLNVPEKNTDNSFYIRYEGPGWESDKVGYRFYLDWRNANDIFGKKTTDMVLQNVGKDGFDSYHEESDWGMDILKVGSSLGIGSIGYWNGEKALRIATTDSIHCEILQNGIIYSSIETNYFGWKDAGNLMNLKSQISIEAGSRLSYQQIKLSKELDNICTGFVKHENTNLISSSDTSKWSYLASFGKQSLNDDNLGLFIFYKNSDFIQLEQDENSHVLVLKPNNKSLDYYFGAIWEKDVDKISTQESFLAYLNRKLFQLNNPININYFINEK